MKILARRPPPKTPLTHTDEFTLEEIASFFWEECGLDLSGEDEEMLLLCVDEAKQCGLEAVARTQRLADELAEHIDNRSTLMVYHDSFAEEEHQMNLQMQSQESRS